MTNYIKSFSLATDTMAQTLSPKGISVAQFNQGDVNTDTLNLTITHNNSVMDLTGATVSVVFSKPDGKIVYQDTTNGVTVTNATQGQLSISLNTQTRAVAGVVVGAVRVTYPNNQILETEKFSFNVEQSLASDQAIASVNDVSGLIGTATLTTNAQNIKGAINEVNANVNSNTASLAAMTQMRDLKSYYGAKGNANYYNSSNQKYYQDSAYTIPATDDTQSILNAWNDSQNLGIMVRVPEGNYIFSQPLVATKSITFYCPNKYKGQFIKNFNGNGIWLKKDWCVLDGIALVNAQNNTADTGHGVILGDEANNLTSYYSYVDMYVFGMGGHGLFCQRFDEGQVKGFYWQNKMDGVHVEGRTPSPNLADDVNANVFNVDVMGNGQHGMSLIHGTDNQIRICTQGNGWKGTGFYGLYINTPSNSGQVYSEGNTNNGVYFDASGFASFFHLHVNDGIVYNNNTNIAVVNDEKTGNTYIKLMQLNMLNAILGTYSAPVTSVPANGHADSTTSAIFYGMSSPNTVITATPMNFLPDGITYEAVYSAANVIAIRYKNMTGSVISVPATTFKILAITSI